MAFYGDTPLNPLDGARFKILRAEGQLHALQDEIAWFLAGEPYIAIRKFDEHQSRNFFFAHINQLPPARISIMIGEFVHNLRSALDHIAWQLTPEGRRNSNTKFPIADLSGPLDPAAWFGQQIPNALAGVDSGAIEEIRGLQPYNGWESGEHPLSVLHALWVADKHHSIAILGSYIAAMKFTISPNTVGRDFGYSSGAFYEGKLLLDLPVDPNTQEHFDPKITFGVSLGEEWPTRGAPIPDELRKMYDFIAQDAFPRFARFFA